MPLRLLKAARLLLASPLRSSLEDLRPQMAKAAQEVLDHWEVDENGEDEVFGGGGACDAIASALSDVMGHLDAKMQEGGQDGDDHAYWVVYNDTEAFVVDIPPGVYETGGGYSWKKIEGAQVEPSDIVIDPLDRSWIEDIDD